MKLHNVAKVNTWDKAEFATPEEKLKYVRSIRDAARMRYTIAAKRLVYWEHRGDVRYVTPEESVSGTVPADKKLITVPLIAGYVVDKQCDPSLIKTLRELGFYYSRWTFARILHKKLTDKIKLLTNK